MEEAAAGPDSPHSQQSKKPAVAGVRVVARADGSPSAPQSSSTTVPFASLAPLAAKQLPQMEEAAAGPDTPHSQQQTRKPAAAPVKIVARVCPGGTGAFKVATSVVDSSAVVSLHPLRKDTTPRPGDRHPDKVYDFGFDRCYLKDDACHQIFDIEVKPLVDAIFSGTNSCVVSCGASAKANLIKGPPSGLLTMAMEQILLLSKPTSAAVSVSSYQMFQDTHIFDVLERKENEVLVLEGADGRTNLKGLSKVRVKSMEEFENLLCSCGTNMVKHAAKPSNNSQPRGGHHGFIIYVSRLDQEGKECAVAKMNFLELAAYVDPKQSTNGGGLSVQNHSKSMHALMNVVHALNTNQSFIQYRQSKLTRILQDSLCKTSKAVLIACVDEISGQDVVSTLSLASRSRHRVNEQYLGTRSSSKSNANLSLRRFGHSVVKASQTPAGDKRSNVATYSAQKAAKPFSTNMKQRGTKPILSGRRKLFCPGTDLSKEDKTIVSPVEETKFEESRSLFCMQAEAAFQSLLDMESKEHNQRKNCTKILLCSPEGPVSREEDPSSGLHTNHSSTNSKDNCSYDGTDEAIEKTQVNHNQSSPDLTDRLREISNHLKFLSTKPISVTTQKPESVDPPDVHMDSSEPKTPMMHLKFEGLEDSLETCKARTTGIKKKLAKECLMYLNSANKEELKSLKGIGEKRANYILELRQESPELFKEVDDLKNIIGMNKKEIKNLMTDMYMN